LSWLATVFFVPAMPAERQMSYGSQLKVLKKPVLWASMLAVIFLNGSVYGVFNYMADYLASVAGLPSFFVSILLFLYGACNIIGSMAAGRLLTDRPVLTVMAFPPAMAAVYLALFLGSGAWPLATALIVLWGVLGGINANINQYWISHAAPEAPDFANGLFLTAANIGCMAGTSFCGLFIDAWGMEQVIFGGLGFLAAAGLLLRGQCHGRSLNPAAIAGEARSCA
ncbi:MAG: MFS transporter, partial [Desulfovibrio sp.]